ncbi:NAD(P)/FAD-dependent oxidoreductase [Streptomyces sp. NPDC085540]|uniref:NAD(P)/FAD-dependent oxidoreductase n=1 Tax=Streptomyces sp. NPDC085540 TaxID=3365730 RepID=UPI0037D1B093
MGSGPAGYTAALYTARAQLRPCCSAAPSSSAAPSPRPPRWRTFPASPTGSTAPTSWPTCGPRREKFGAEMIDDDIASVNLTGKIKEVTDSEGTVHRAKSVIIATGSGYRRLGLPKADELSGRGVFWWATCDGFFFKGRDTAMPTRQIVVDPDLHRLPQRRLRDCGERHPGRPEPSSGHLL